MAAALLPLFATPAGTATAAAAATAIGPVTAAASGAAALAGYGSLLSTGLTAASAFGTIMSGQQQSAAYKAQAKQYDLSAKQEELRGREQADKIRRSLQATIASQNAAWGARGVSSTGGTPVNLAAQSYSNASYDIQTAQFGSGMSAAADRGQAAQSRMSGSAARVAGYGEAATRLRSLIA